MLLWYAIQPPLYPCVFVGVHMVYIFISAWASVLFRSAVMGNVKALGCGMGQRVQSSTLFYLYATTHKTIQTITQITYCRLRGLYRQHKNNLYMKHLLTLTAMLCAFAGASAQSVKPIVTQTGSYYGYIPAEFTYDNKVKLTDYNSHNDEIPVFDDFVKVKAVALPTPVSAYKIIRSREGVGGKVDSLRKEIGQFYSLEKSINYLNSQGYGSFEYQYAVNYIDTILVRNSDDFFKFDEFGTKYPQYYYLYEGNSGILYGCRDYYQIAYTGDWTETREDDGGTSSMARIRFIDYDSGNPCEDDPVWLTQTLFNSDSKYEYVRSKIRIEAGKSYEQDRDNDGVVDYEATFYRTVCVGFEIVSEDGTVLQSVDFARGTLDDRIEGYILKLNGKYYLMFDTYERCDSEGTNYYKLVYSIDKGTTSVQQVGEPRRISVRPSLAERHAPITVETPDAQRDRRLTVTNAAGQTVWKQIIPAGQSSVQIDGSRLSRGLNIVNVEGDSKQDNSCKVIVK